MQVSLIDTGIIYLGSAIVEDEITLNWYWVDPKLLTSFADVDWSEPFIPTEGCMFIDNLPFEGNA